MSRGRPPLPVGAYGAISFLEVAPRRVRARARFRDYDGRVRYVASFGPSRASAERRLKQAITSRGEVAAAGEISRDMRVAALAEEWLRKIETTDLAKSTRARYADIVAQFVLKGVGQLRLYELTVPSVDRFLGSVNANHGAASAKGAKSVLSGMCGLAMRHGAITTNPTIGTTPIASAARKAPRALTADDEPLLVKRVAEDLDGQRLDLVDLVIFMLGTGARIGEACALRTGQVDLDASTVEINATVTKFGIEERPKTRAGWRVIAIPSHVTAVLQRRVADPTIRTDVALFPSPIGRVRDTSNTSADLRRLLDATGFPWATSHTFRKTVATRLDEAGLSARAIADHLGHARPSMTLDVYMGRNVASAEAAGVLHRD